MTQENHPGNPTRPKLDCVIIAGGLAGPDDPIYAYTKGEPKALLDMGGRRMLERVVDGLQSSQFVNDICVVGLGDTSHVKQFQFQRPVRHLPDHGSMVDNALAGIRYMRQLNPAREMIVCSGDIPAITGEMVDWFVNACAPFDYAMYYTMLAREVCEARYPDSKRTFIKLKDAQIAGGDIFLIQVDITDDHYELWQTLANSRKHAWRLAWIVGPLTVAKLLLRQLTLADLENLASRMLDGRPVKIVLSQYAELGMDADKPYQVDLLRADLAKTGPA
jgi:molybdopterin-guanine dinucleotide biosynthesis protein A